MRNIIALTALLVCAGAWAQDAGEPAEAVKVLGFTLDVPVPPGALPESAEPAVWTDDGAYTVYAAKHPWCDSLIAIADRAHGVFLVRCGVDGSTELWGTRLRMRHGDRVAYELLDRTQALLRTYAGIKEHLVSVYLPDKFAFIESDSDSVYWLSRRGPVDYDRPTVVVFDCDQQADWDFITKCRDEEKEYHRSIWLSTATALRKADGIREKAFEQTVARQSEGEDF